MKDLFEKEADLSVLLSKELKEKWGKLGYEISYQDFPACTTILEFTKETIQHDDIYIQFVFDKNNVLTINFYSGYDIDWLCFDSVALDLIYETKNFLLKVYMENKVE